MIHNHLMLDVARALYARDTPECAALREEVRELILRHARALPPDVPVLLTDALADEPAALSLFRYAEELARDRGTSLRVFVLDLSVAENRLRITDPMRAGGAKLMDVDVLEEIRAQERLFVTEGAVVLDVTAMSAEVAADEICHRLERMDG